MQAFSRCLLRTILDMFLNNSAFTMLTIAVRIL